MNVSRRHHFLPQFLLRGFASQIKGDQHYTYLFRLGAPTKEVNIINVAQQRDFHGPAESRLETLMSEHEARYAPVVEQARCGRVIDIAILCEFVANLMTRTRNLRLNFVNSTNIFLETMEEQLLLSPCPKTKLGLKKQTRKELNKAFKGQLSHLSPNQRTIARRMFNRYVRGLDLRPLFADTVRGVREQVDLASIMSKSHIETLTRTPAPELRVAQLKELHWTVDVRSKPTWILGDVGCVIGLTGTRDLSGPLDGDGKQLRTLFMPLSARVLLSGTSDIDGLQLDPDTINGASAELSQEFFVSSCNAEREQNWHRHIAERANILDYEKALALTKEIL